MLQRRSCLKEDCYDRVISFDKSKKHNHFKHNNGL